MKDLENFDIYRDLKHAQAANALSGKILADHVRTLEDDDEIEESYKIVLLCILSKEKRLKLDNKRKDRDDDGECNVLGENDGLRLESCNGRRGRGRGKGGKCNVLVESNPRSAELCCKRKDRDDVSGCTDKKKDPEYELFLRHLKGCGKAYALEYKRDGLSVVFQYEPSLGSGEKHDLEPRGSDEVENAKDLPIEMVANAEHFSLNKNVIVKQYVRRRDNRTVTETLYGRQGGDEEKGKMSSNVVRPQVELLNQMPSVRNKHTCNPQQPSVQETNDSIPRISRNVGKMVENEAQVLEYRRLHRNMKHEKDRPVYKHNAKNIVNKKIYGVNRKIEKKRRLTQVMNERVRVSDRMPSDVLSPSVKKTKGIAFKKMRNEAGKVENVNGLLTHTRLAPEYNDHQVKLEGSSFTNAPNNHTLVSKKMFGLNARNIQDRSQWRRDTRQRVGLSNEMLAAVNGHRHDMQPTTVKNTKGSIMRKSSNVDELRNVKAAKGAMENEKLGETNIKEENRDDAFSDVEILNSVACSDKGISTHFVPSRRFTNNEKSDASLARIEFRRRVLEYLKRPYDKREYIKHREAVIAGSYFDYHPDLQRKLAKYRYKRGKLLTILRGFFYWLQNVMQEGAFKPWKDRECLAVESSCP